MTTLTLFIIVLIVGISLMIIGAGHTQGMSKLLFMIFGLLICGVGIFGIMTSFL